MKIIGLTGPSGSGKGELCAVLAQFGIFSIDTDRVYHQLLIPPSDCLNELCNYFGAHILNGDGTLNRAALAKTVFEKGAEEKLDALNKITHKYILDKTDMLLSEHEKSSCRAAIVDAPALYEAKYDEKCDFVIAVIAPKQLRLKRIMKRDSLTEEAAQRRISAQHDDVFYTSKAKYTVVNDNNEEKLISDLCNILCSEGLLP